jgi:hypothetical protein
MIDFDFQRSCAFCLQPRRQKIYASIVAKKSLTGKASLV